MRMGWKRLAFVLATAVINAAAEEREGSGLDDCVFIVDILDSSVAPETKLAASVAVGLLNRLYDRPTAMALNTPNDWKWADDIRKSNQLGAVRWVGSSPADIIAYAVAVGAVTSTITYAPAETWSIANVVTMAGLQSALPVPFRFSSSPDSKAPKELPRTKALAFSPEVIALNGGTPPRARPPGKWGGLDLQLGLNALGGNMSDFGVDVFLGVEGLPQAMLARQKWVNELDATLWAWQNLYPDCEATDDIVATQRPELLQQGFLADFIVSKRMFAFFLPDMCQPGAQQLMFRSMTEQPYSTGKQLKVMGYFPAAEVVADCSLHHTEISLVSDWCPNLSFYSRMAPITAVLPQVPLAPAPVYDPSHVYLAVINSDGDNMQMENNGNRDGMEARVDLCSQPGSVCPPLAWTISNQLATYAPFLLQWYYDQARKTGKDTFMMGPSGYGFIHPAAIASNESVLTDFVANTVNAAEQLSMTSYVLWDVDGNGLTQQSMAHTGIYSSQAASLAPAASKPESGPQRWQGVLQETVSAATSWLNAAVRGAGQAVERLQGASMLGRGDVSGRGPARRLQSEAMHETRPRGGDSGQGEVGLAGVDGVPTGEEASVGSAENSFAREAFLHRFDGTVIDTIFAPGEFNIPQWIGNIAGVNEQMRWGIPEVETMSVVEQANNLANGTIGYLYKIFFVDMKELELFAQKLSSRVHLVDYRQLHDLALQKKKLNEGR